MKSLVKRSLALALLATSAVPAAGAAAVPATLYKNPDCLCCNRYATYLEQRGFDVELIDTQALATKQQQLGVTPELAGCHTMLVDGYVVDGLVPVAIVNRLLRERPEISGITLPGMPGGAPGMDAAPQQGPFVVYAFGGSATAPAVFAVQP